MLLRLILSALLLWPAAAPARSAETARERRFEKRAERTKREARAVLAALLRDVEIEPTACTFDVHWSSRPVDAGTAQTYLGSSLDADVVASHLSVGPSDLIDPDGKMRGSFCPENHANALWRQMVDDFRSGANPGKPDTYEGKPISPPRVRLMRADVTVPVFDRRFTTAAVVAGYVTRNTWKCSEETMRERSRFCNEAGFSRILDIEGFGYTYVYRKRRGRWTQISHHQDWTSN